VPGLERRREHPWVDHLEHRADVEDHGLDHGVDPPVVPGNVMPDILPEDTTNRGAQRYLTNEIS
jgi:hypothetical protein